jgi:hypothetical protein
LRITLYGDSGASVTGRANIVSRSEHGDLHATKALEQGLEGLWRLAADLGANTVAVLVFEAASCEIAYCRTQEGEVLRVPSSIPCGGEMRIALDSAPAPLNAGSTAARFLTSTVAPAANSFFVFPSRIRPRGAAVLFGFADDVNLAALAAWSVEEVRRLRAELGLANRAFAGRKLVERAKLTLQSERGMSEHQAYEYLRRMSRQRRIPMPQFAEDLLHVNRF